MNLVDVEFKALKYLTAKQYLAMVLKARTFVNSTQLWSPSPAVQAKKIKPPFFASNKLHGVKAFGQSAGLGMPDERQVYADKPSFLQTFQVKKKNPAAEAGIRPLHLRR